ncbi:hypothetical protein PTKIN_Ptkin13bG0104400 [Pterospermum kingtungense]
MAKEIQSLLHKFSSDEEGEEDLVLEKSWVEESAKEVKNCLVGKLIIPKPYLIEEFDGMSNMEDLNFHYSPFWVQIQSLPVGLMSEQIGIVIGETIGEIEEVDLDENCRAWDGGKVMVKFRYEHLSDVCYVCGMLTHQEADCHTWVQLKKEGSAGGLFGSEAALGWKTATPRVEVFDESTIVRETQGLIDVMPIAQGKLETVMASGGKDKVVEIRDKIVLCSYRSHVDNVDHGRVMDSTNRVEAHLSDGLAVDGRLSEA